MTCEPQSLGFYARRGTTLVKPPLADLTEGQCGVARERVDSEALALGLAFQLAEETLGLRLCLGLRDSEAPAARSVRPTQDVTAIAEENTHREQSPSCRPYSDRGAALSKGSRLRLSASPRNQAWIARGSKRSRP